MADVVVRRHQDREELLALARSYVGRLKARLSVVAAAVVGSVARGDFNVWSDVDVVVVAEELPERAPERAALLLADAPGRVQPVGFTPGEFRRAWRRGNPLARAVATEGVVLLGEGFFAEAAGQEA
ncbi:MAG: nucleotidyltransferase domain-containing protein [Armatimonadota bacterium]|nr:nucleotidyltransferase domain-containing protein [Armatimonadota bacterium]MDW8155506.1 nucleotidyltransferase domain-containing protein [Armatimonadota bacterium]